MNLRRRSSSSFQISLGKGLSLMAEQSITVSSTLSILDKYCILSPVQIDKARSAGTSGASFSDYFLCRFIFDQLDQTGRGSVTFHEVRIIHGLLLPSHSFIPKLTEAINLTSHNTFSAPEMQYLLMLLELMKSSVCCECCSQCMCSFS